jgi:L-arabinokinase
MSLDTPTVYNQPFMSVLFYVSGHGYGHATRMAQVIRAGAPQWEAIVRTEAPPRLFPGSRVECAVIDAAVAESPDTLRIDGRRTLDNWIEFARRREAIVRREAEYVRDSGARLIVADMPFLAGEIAAKAGVPCIAIGNFTWSWILAPHFAHDQQGREVLRVIDAGYARMQEYWRLPFSHPADRATFRCVIDTPLVAPDIRMARRLDRRRTVLIGFRGRVPAEAFRRAASESPDTLFLTFDADLASAAPNIRLVQVTPEQSFPDLAAGSDLILAKLGYGLLATCVAGRHRLLYAPREGFREDEVTSVEAARYTALRAIPRGDFDAGNWRPHIDRLLADPMPAGRMAQDGAAICAGRIAARLRANPAS